MGDGCIAFAGVAAHAVVTVLLRAIEWHYVQYMYKNIVQTRDKGVPPRPEAREMSEQMYLIVTPIHDIATFVLHAIAGHGTYLCEDSYKYVVQTRGCSAQRV